MVRPDRSQRTAAPMSELFFLLIGARVLRRKWRLVLAVGLAWLLLGAFLFTDAFIADIRIPSSWFAVPLTIDAVLSLAAAVAGPGGGRSLRLGKALLLLAVVAVIVQAPWHQDMIVGILVGLFLVADAVWRGASAWLVRQPRWRWWLAVAVGEFLMGVWSFVLWPTHWQGEVGSDVGLLIMVSAVSVLAFALRLRRLPLGRAMAAPIDSGADSAPDAPPPARGAATVHVWTPTGALARPGVRRYIVSRDQGTLSTGHAALEAPGLYISHYPGAIQRTASAVKQTLRLLSDQDIDGSFQPGLDADHAIGPPATVTIDVPGLDLGAVAAFWGAYRGDATYNLTKRNCASGVVQALDAGVEGVFQHEAASPWFLLRLLFLPELWLAGMIRRRAAAMAWTPGLLLDYARALAVVLRLPQRLGGDPRQPRYRRS
jgi:uncharacterized membrane protein HdeD (DUF308 family)